MVTGEGSEETGKTVSSRTNPIANCHSSFALDWARVIFCYKNLFFFFFCDAEGAKRKTPKADTCMRNENFLGSFRMNIIWRRFLVLAEERKKVKYQQLR